MMLAPAAISRYSRSLQRALPARAAPATRGLPAVSSCCAGPFINARPAPATMAAADLPDGSAAALARDLAREAASGSAPARREAVAALAACLVRLLSSLPAAPPAQRPRRARASAAGPARRSARAGAERAIYPARRAPLAFTASARHGKTRRSLPPPHARLPCRSAAPPRCIMVMTVPCAAHAPRSGCPRPLQAFPPERRERAKAPADALFSPGRRLNARTLRCLTPPRGSPRWWR